MYSRHCTWWAVNWCDWDCKLSKWLDYCDDVKLNTAKFKKCYLKINRNYLQIFKISGGHKNIFSKSAPFIGLVSSDRRTRISTLSSYQSLKLNVWMCVCLYYRLAVHNERQARDFGINWLIVKCNGVLGLPDNYRF